jgi:hypothetical protein
MGPGSRYGPRPQVGNSHACAEFDRRAALAAVEYKDAGYTRVQGWIDSARNNLRTDAARRIAGAALCTSPLAWRGRCALRRESAAGGGWLTRSGSRSLLAASG